MHGDAACAVCAWEVRPRPARELVVAESDLWIVRHHMAPAPLVGWMQLISRRHVQGPAGFHDREAADFGRALRDVCNALVRVTGAAKAYAIAFGEGSPHLHVHCVPRYAERGDTAAWKVADWYRQVERGERPPAAAEDVTRCVLHVRAELMTAESMRWQGPAAG
ncbi:MAG: diadenosine tetraphosphate hydrolase [Phycisphaerae bacterium]|jgi:diadenosine tetraphosphate (Ap4A) HIT family hydrolase|nr:diadenosine tetraphosphate hydrolase [Phycisphaerae bacterium]